MLQLSRSGGRTGADDDQLRQEALAKLQSTFGESSHCHRAAAAAAQLAAAADAAAACRLVGHSPLFGMRPIRARCTLPQATTVSVATSWMPSWQRSRAGTCLCSCPPAVS